jgi:mannose-6-phosphate isomerase-like protein (cupin superfamily)/catechol 2,3-dioxygenase-like lactoylglutathione lyase family enzyme
MPPSAARRTIVITPESPFPNPEVYAVTTTNSHLDSVQHSIATEPETSRAWWFLGTLAVLRNPPGAPRTPAVIELTVAPGGSPPEHVHDALDDAFLLLEGELAVRCGEQSFLARPGAYVVMPHGVPHTFRVTSATPAKMLQVHADDSFLRFIEALGTPTSDHRLPPPGEFDLDPGMLAVASAEHGAPMIGAPLAEDEARGIVARAARDAGRSREDTLGPIGHVALAVTDVARSADWYANTLDLVEVERAIAEDGTGHVTMVSPSGGWVVALGSAPVPSVAHVAFGCADRPALCRWRDMLAARGIEPGTITDADYGSGFVVRDPDGLEVELFAPAGA